MCEAGVDVGGRTQAEHALGRVTTRRLSHEPGRNSSSSVVASRFEQHHEIAFTPFGEK